MRKIDVGALTTLFANVGILVGLLLVALELNQNTRQLALTLEWQVNQRIVDNNRDFGVESMREIYAKSVTNPHDLTFAEFQTAAGFVFNFINVWEDRYFMYEHGLISDQDWRNFIDDDIGYTLGNPFARELWSIFKGNYEPELVEYVDTLLPGIDTDVTYGLYLRTLNGIADSGRPE